MNKFDHGFIFVNARNKWKQPKCPGIETDTKNYENLEKGKILHLLKKSKKVLHIIIWKCISNII